MDSVSVLRQEVPGNSSLASSLMISNTLSSRSDESQSTDVFPSESEDCCTAESQTLLSNEIPKHVPSANNNSTNVNSQVTNEAQLPPACLSNGCATPTYPQIKKSSIPRLMPSSIPRLQPRMSTSVCYSTQRSTVSNPPAPHNHVTSNRQTGNTVPSDRSRLLTRPNTRVDRSTSEHPQSTLEAESDASSVFSSGSVPRKITSKVGSLQNVQHKPGGGNVRIVDEKVKIGPITSKCNSLANVKHKPGGGNVQIVDVKIDTSTVQPKVNSMQNVKHVPTGGQVQIVSEKLEFDKKAKSKVGSLQNARHQPGGGDVQIYNETLPWLKYNKPNLPPEERSRINKHRTTSHGDMSSSVHSGSTVLTSHSGKTS